MWMYQQDSDSSSNEDINQESSDYNKGYDSSDYYDREWDQEDSSDENSFDIIYHQSQKQFNPYKFQSQVKIQEQQKECWYFKKGICKYGNSCRNLHIQKQIQVPTIKEEEKNEIKDQDCGICLQGVLENKKQFGLLQNCKHAFCLDCIRKWRQQQDQSKNVVRSCPLCREESFLVIPSPYFIENFQKKQQMLEEYKNNLCLIPCKYFKEGRGKCPFSNSCFYEHKFSEEVIEEKKQEKLLRKRIVNFEF